MWPSGALHLQARVDPKAVDFKPTLKFVVEFTWTPKQ